MGRGSCIEEAEEREVFCRRYRAYNFGLEIIISNDNRDVLTATWFLLRAWYDSLFTIAITNVLIDVICDLPRVVC